MHNEQRLADREHQATKDAHAKSLKDKEDAFNRVKHGLADYINAQQSLQYIDVEKFDAWIKDVPVASQRHLLEHTREIPFSVFTSEDIVESNTPVVEGMSSFYYCLLMLTLRFGIPGTTSQPSGDQVVVLPTSS